MHVIVHVMLCIHCVHLTYSSLAMGVPSTRIVTCSYMHHHVRFESRN